MTGLLKLPQELMLQVFRSTDRKDWLAVSRTCWQLRHSVYGLVFNDIYVGWDTLDGLLEEIGKNGRMPLCIGTLHITESSSKGEWHSSDKLRELAGRCTNMTKLDLKISGTSAWIKFMTKCEQITQMCIHSQKAADRRKFADNGSIDLPLFDIGDLFRAFPNVDQLFLEGFIIRNDDESDTNIDNLTLLNCAWDYPFDPKNVGSQMKTMALKYTRNYTHLTHLERVKSFCIDPPLSLTFLHLEFDVGHMQKAWHPLSASSKSSKLERLKLSGFESPAASFFGVLPLSLKLVEIEILDNYTNEPEKLSLQCPQHTQLLVTTRIEKPHIEPQDLSPKG